MKKKLFSHKNPEHHIMYGIKHGVIAGVIAGTVCSIAVNSTLTSMLLPVMIFCAGAGAFIGGTYDILKTDRRAGSSTSKSNVKPATKK